MSFFCTYSFEGIPVSYGGRTGLADGSFCVEYCEARPDPSVGYSGGPEIIDYSDLDVTITFDDDTVLEPTDKDERRDLLKQISRKIDVDDVYEHILRENY